jgi:hypothetical protein
MPTVDDDLLDAILAQATSDTANPIGKEAIQARFPHSGGQTFPRVAFKQGDVPLKFPAEPDALLSGIGQQTKVDLQVNAARSRQATKPRCLILDRVSGDDAEAHSQIQA